MGNMKNGKLDPKTSSLSNVYKTFVKTVEELEKSLMFPSMLTDIPVEYPDEVKLFNGSINDCKDLFVVLKSIKNSVLFDLKKNWFAGVQGCDCGSRSPRSTNVSRFVETKIQFHRGKRRF